MSTVPKSPPPVKSSPCDASFKEGRVSGYYEAVQDMLLVVDVRTGQVIAKMAAEWMTARNAELSKEYSNA